MRKNNTRPSYSNHYFTITFNDKQFDFSQINYKYNISNSTEVIEDLPIEDYKVFKITDEETLYIILEPICTMINAKRHICRMLKNLPRHYSIDPINLYRIRKEVIKLYK